MANNQSIDTSSLTALITEFRRLQAKDSITPEALGSILQRIAELLASAGSSIPLQLLCNWHDALTNALPYMASVEQLNFDRNNVLLNPTLVDPIDGDSFVDNATISIQPATSDYAGVMTAQQVQELNNLKFIVDSLLGTSDEGSALSAKGQIAVEIVNGQLCVYGSNKLAEAGFVPYLFRHTRKRNRNNTLLDDEGKGTFGAVSKGWHLFGSRHSVKVEDNVALFSINESKKFHEEASGYTSDPEALVHTRFHDNGKVTLPWGRSSINIFDFRANQNRLIRLRFAIGYAKPIDHAKGKVNVLNLVSNLAEFSVVYNPKSDAYSLSR